MTAATPQNQIIKKGARVWLDDRREYARTIDCNPKQLDGDAIEYSMIRYTVQTDSGVCIENYPAYLMHMKPES